MNVLITGGTGMIGQQLAKKLIDQGHEVRILTRKLHQSAYKQYVWDINLGTIDPAALSDLDAIVHLAGASVADGRWTAKRKQIILTSRRKSAELLHGELKRHGVKLKSFISASGIGIYGNRPNEVLEEGSSSGDGFLVEVCKQWENAAKQFEDVSQSVYINRIGIVIGRHGGFVAKIKPMLKYYVASKLGTGRQISSWIHEDDLVDILAAEVSGVLPSGTYNAVSPNPVAHSKIMKLLAKKFNSYIWLPNVPKFVLRLIFGELAEELTSHQNAKPTLLKKHGFKFKYDSIEQAIDALSK